MPRLYSGTTTHNYLGLGGSQKMYLGRKTMPADGWITDFSLVSYYAGQDSGSKGIYANLYVDSKKVYDYIRSISNSSAQEFTFNIPAAETPRVDKGSLVRWGAGQWSSSPTLVMSAHNEDTNSYGSATPGTLPSATNTYPDQAPKGYVDYVEQKAPTAGSITSPTQNQALSTTTVTISGSTPHGNGDSAYDYSTKVQVRIFEGKPGDASNPVVKDETFDTTDAQQNSKTFSRAFSGLASGKTYFANFRHYDSWNVPSPFSGDRIFSVADIPDTPIPVAPLGTINTTGPYAYQFVYNNPEGRAAEQYEVELRDSTGNTVIWASTTRNTTAGPSETISYTPTFSSTAPDHPWLGVGLSYTWRARVKDTLGGWSNWSAAKSADFKVNARPYEPVFTKPQNNEKTGDLEVRVALSDPDGDPITACELELTRVSTGLTVDLNAGAAGVAASMTISQNGTVGSYVIPQGLIVTNTQYRMRARATDGKVGGYGIWSTNRTFTYVIAPTPALVIPAAAGRTNTVTDPSFEEDLTGSGAEFWTVEGATGTQDEGDTKSWAAHQTGQDAAFGRGRLRIHKAAATGDLTVRSKRIPIDVLSPYRLQLHAKKEPSAGGATYLPASARLYVRCLDAAGNPVGGALANVYPSSIAQLGSGGNDLDIHWKAYGGYVRRPGGTVGPPPTGMPAGTTQVELVFTLGAAVEQDCAIDGVMFEKVPEVSSATWTNFSAFYGYADPDLPEYGAGGYEAGGAYGGGIGTWTGEPNRSTSQVLHILDRADLNSALLSYVHPAGVAKLRDRLTITKLSANGVWDKHHDGEWRTTTSTTIPLPDFVFENEQRYRMRVDVGDVNALEGTTQTVEFVARYVGPPELAILSYQDDPNNGTLTISFEPTTLPPAEFAGIEIARECKETGERLRTVAVLTDPAQTTFTYHYPVSDRTYRYHVRQLKLVGPYLLASARRFVDAVVSYPDWNFLKSAEDPENIMVAFQHTSGSGPDYPREKPNEAYIPWGAAAPVNLFGEGDWRSGETAFTLWPYSDRPAEQERISMLKKMRRISGALCLMTDKPQPEKTWIAMTGPLSITRSGRYPSASFSWTQNSYAEDAYAARGGVVESG